MAATSAGYSVLGQHLTSVATILPMILGAGGVGLAAATTRRASADQPQQPDSASTSA